MIKKNLNKELMAIHESYMNDFIKTISRTYKVEPHELRKLWKEQQQSSSSSSCNRRKQQSTCFLETINHHHDIQEEPQEQQLWKSLGKLKEEDLTRHCLKNGIQPPLHRDDMIHAIITKVCRS